MAKCKSCGGTGKVKEEEDRNVPKSKPGIGKDQREHDWASNKKEEKPKDRPKPVIKRVTKYPSKFKKDLNKK